MSELSSLGGLCIDGNTRCPQADNENSNQGLVVQSIVRLTSSLVVKMFSVLVSTISKSQVFLLKIPVNSFCKCKS